MNLAECDSEYLLFGTLFVIGNKLQTIGDSFFEEISSKQWFALCMLDVFGEEYPTLNELSNAMGSSHQNVKQLVLKLENKGYVKLFVDESDKRKTRISMTEKCDEFREKYGIRQQDLMKQLFGNISEEDMETTLKTLKQLEKNMEG